MSQDEVETPEEMYQRFGDTFTVTRDEGALFSLASHYRSQVQVLREAILKDKEARESPDSLGDDEALDKALEATTPDKWYINVR